MKLRLSCDTKARCDFASELPTFSGNDHSENLRINRCSSDVPIAGEALGRENTAATVA
jgi:hypothetical protein